MRQKNHTPEDMNLALIFQLRDVGHLMRAQYEGKASQRRILIVLLQTGDITQHALTELLGIQPGSASEILAKMEQAGLITRTLNAADRRTADISLTQEGRTLAEDALARREKRHVEMFACLTAAEKKTLLALLERLHADWNRRVPEHLRREMREGYAVPEQTTE